MKKQGKRVKTKAVVAVSGWHQADQMLRRIASLQRSIERLESKYAGQAEKVKASKVKEIKPLQEKIGVLQRSLEHFATSHKKDFRKKRSKRLNFGVLGWRKSTTTKVTKNTIALIRKCFSASQVAVFLRSKESVDKEALAKLSDPQLKKIGAERTVKEVFFVEPTPQKTVDYK